MSVTDPAATPALDGAKPRPAGTTAAGANGAAANPFLSHLQSLRELQITLSQEGRAESILNEGTTGTVEIVGADCAIAVVEPSNGQAPLRFGWIEGRQMAQHEIAVLCRRYEEAFRRVRSGQVSRLVLGAGAETESGEAEGPPAGSQKFGVTLLLGIDASIGSRGALLLARHDPLPFNREQVLMADILVTLMSIQIERALRATDARRAGERLQDECAAATRSLRETTLELQAIEAVATAATPSLDLHRQIEIALRKTLEMTRFKVGAVFLVEETNGEERLRFARGDGDRAYLDLAQGRSHRRGEGIAGRVWESGESLTCADISSAPPPQGTEEIVALRRAGYRALICMPLRARGRVLGMMELLSSDARPELESRPALAQAIAGQIAIVIQNARLLSDVMRHCLELEMVQQTQGSELTRWSRGLAEVRGVLEGAARQNDLRQTLDAALGGVLELLGYPAGTVHLVDPGTRALHLKATRGLSSGALEQLGFRISRTMIGRALESGAPGFEPDEQTDRLDADGMTLRAAVPLRAASGVHGVLAIAAAERRVLRDTETHALAVVGTVLGLLVENSRAFPSAPPQGPPPNTELTAQLVQAQKMESIGTLAGGIAHEFNNILTAILGYASHIRSLTTGDNPIHRQATTIEEQSRRAAELTQQLLAFAHGGQYTLEPLDMNQAIAETVSFLSKGLDPRVTIETRLAPDLPEIEGDKGQIRQVLVSLAVNAAEAMPEGGRITFESRLAHLGRQYAVSRPDLVPGDYVEVVIGDTGVGMTPEMADRVFEPFFTTKANAKSTGLGLSVVYGIVRNHKGHVTLSSAPDLGTTLRVYLPVFDRGRRAAAGGAAPAVPRAPAPPPGRVPVVPAPFERVSIVEVDRRRPKGPQAALPPAQETTAPPAAKPATSVATPAPKDPKTSVPAASPDRKRRILVIDDEESVRDMARELLESHGFEVVLAVDGVDALDVYRREWGRIDVVLLDMVMPRMGGFETYRRLVGMDRAAKVLLVSGYADSDKAQKVLKEGALGLLQKPFTITELVGWIDRVLGRK